MLHIQNTSSSSVSNNPFRQIESRKPEKFLLNNNRIRINPEYENFMQRQGKNSSERLSRKNPLVCNVDEYKSLNKTLNASGQQERPLTEVTQMSLMMLQDPEVSNQVGLTPNELLHRLGHVFALQDNPIGMMSKLLLLTQLDKMHFIVSDAASMTQKSKLLGSDNQPITRWEEARLRISSLFKILSLIPHPPIELSCLNRSNTLLIQRLPHDTPETYFYRATESINAYFSTPPSGPAPTLDAIVDSLAFNGHLKTGRFYVGDGKPSGGAAEINLIQQLISNRMDPENNPFTFMSCTDKEADAQWMKQTEEVYPFCAEYSNFKSEKTEVRGDQGKALTYTVGMHISAQIFGAMCPQDLGKMDEAIPITKTIYDEIYGIKHSDQDYSYYFNEFLKTQSEREVHTNVDHLKKNWDWSIHYHDFLNDDSGLELEVAKQFQAQLELAASRDQARPARVEPSMVTATSTETHNNADPEDFPNEPLPAYTPAYTPASAPPPAYTERDMHPPQAISNISVEPTHAPSLLRRSQFSMRNDNQRRVSV